MESSQLIRHWKHRVMMLASAAGLLLCSVQSLGGEPFTPSPFTIPQGAYSAEFVEDTNHITVMKFSGSYDRKLPGGEANAAARAVVAKEFYKHHPDNYDFLVVFTSFEFNTGDAKAFYIPVKNDIQGLGEDLFDNSALFGSNSKLQGYIDMAAMSRYNMNPYSPDFESVLGILAHENLHRWALYNSGTYMDAPILSNKNLQNCLFLN